MATALPTVSRVVAVVVGGYAATMGLVALASVLLALGLGWQRSEAIVLATLVGFLVYTAVIIWGFAEARLLRLWAVLGGIALLAHLAAVALAAGLPPAIGGA